MDNASINSLMDSKDAQNTTINEAINEVKSAGIDGVNIDFEYVGNPGDDYKNKFSEFVYNIVQKIHRKVPNSRLTVPVYAASVKDTKLYDIRIIAKHTVGI